MAFRSHARVDEDLPMAFSRRATARACGCAHRRNEIDGVVVGDELKRVRDTLYGALLDDRP